jgi:hypothetical protein
MIVSLNNGVSLCHLTGCGANEQSLFVAAQICRLLSRAHVIFRLKACADVADLCIESYAADCRTALRPVTPPEDRDELEPRSSGDKSIAMKATGAELRRQHLHSQQHSRHHQQLQPGERVITVANPELLMQLFDVLPKETPSKTGHRSYGNHGKKISRSVSVGCYSCM